MNEPEMNAGSRRTDSIWSWTVRSLSARLLILTIAFVMLAEVLIFAPSVANFRVTWINEKLGAGHLAILALDATPDGMVSEKLEMELLHQADAYSIAVQRVGAKLALINDMPPTVDASYDIRDTNAFMLIMDAFSTLFQVQDRKIRVVGRSPKDPTTVVDLIIDEAPLRDAMTAFAWRIFLLSLGISIFTASLVYLALQWFLVRPMRRMTRNMVRFAENPEDESRIIMPSRRRDEIGRAQQELADLQRGLHSILAQKEHLAALGTAVAKINHDLKGILSTALVVSDRLEQSEDPEVKRITPTLISSIDRAVALCTQTLDYVGTGTPPIRYQHFELGPVLEEVRQTLPNGAILSCEGLDRLELDADRDQVYRIFSNLARNAAEAGAETITLVTSPDHAPARDNNAIWIDVKDNGPGLPPRAQANLFKPFKGSARSGGTGLGLAIARELIRAHGGDIEMLETGATGTTFRLCLPKKGGHTRA
mgnify:CR=1 FL=1